MVPNSNLRSPLFWLSTFHSSAPTRLMNFRNTLTIYSHYPFPCKFFYFFPAMGIEGSNSKMGWRCLSVIQMSGGATILMAPWPALSWRYQTTNAYAVDWQEVSFQLSAFFSCYCQHRLTCEAFCIDIPGWPLGYKWKTRLCVQTKSVRRPEAIYCQC